MQNTSSVCPRCHSVIPVDAPGGICPACALRGVVEGTDPAAFATSSVPTAEEIAAAFPEYEIRGRIGEGGMSVVFQRRRRNTRASLSGSAARPQRRSRKVAIHRLRQRFREAIKAEIAQTVPETSDIDDELRHLLAMLLSSAE
ncbi:MAG: hypothetical protein ACAI37_01090 [Chthoniobacter sp.]